MRWSSLGRLLLVSAAVFVILLDHRPADAQSLVGDTIFGKLAHAGLTTFNNWNVNPNNPSPTPAVVVDPGIEFSIPPGNVNYGGSIASADFAADTIVLSIGNPRETGSQYVGVYDMYFTDLNYGGPIQNVELISSTMPGTVNFSFGPTSFEAHLPTGVFIPANTIYTAEFRVTYPQWYARGEFNDWSTDQQMVHQGGGYYTRTISGLTEGSSYEFKIGTPDWSQSAPGNNVKARSDATGQLQLHFWDITEWNDGWLPNNQRRVGYDDSGLFDWEIAGTFNDWNGGEAWHLIDRGNGLHTGQFAFDAGVYEFKFRQRGSWDISIGNGDFSNYGSNNVLEVLSDGEVWNFELDLPNGRWRTFMAAEPPGRPGDFNNDDMVDAADYVIWRKDMGDQERYDVWRANFGAGAGPGPEPWYLRGDFNDWGLDNPMVDLGGGHFTATLTGLTPGQAINYKIAREDWSEFEPVNNGISFADVSGNVTFHFYDDTNPMDGWQPEKRRVGYDDHGQFDWELMGEFNNWTGGAEWYMTDTGSGLHRIEKQLAAGDYEFKFRQQENWDVNIGNDFGNHAPNAMVSLPTDGLWAFELDLPGGRWRAVLVSGSGNLAAVPEPSAFMLALFAALVMCGVRRRK